MSHAGVLKRLLPLLRPGGIDVQEFEFAGARSEPRVELFERSLQRIQAVDARILALVGAWARVA